MLDLFTDIREASKTAVALAQQHSVDGKSVDTVQELQEQGAKLFEVLYVGKVQCMILQHISGLFCSLVKHSRISNF